MQFNPVPHPSMSRQGKRSGSLRMLVIVAIALCYLLAGPAYGQPPDIPCDDPSCQAEVIYLNTGVDHTIDSLYPAGARDNYWQVVADDNNANGPIPRNAHVIPRPEATWPPPLAGSHWIAATPTSWNNTIGTAGFEKHFCVCGTDSTDLSFNLKVLADDSASVYFDGEYIASVRRPGYLKPTIITFQRRIFPGRHTLRVSLHNIPGYNAGFDLQGTVSGPGLVKMRCCHAERPMGPCDTNRLRLGTDSSWTMIVVGDTAATRCATVVTPPISAWGNAIAGSQWIAPTSNGNRLVQWMKYIYRKCFCVKRTGLYWVTIQAMSDNSGEVRLDGTQLFTTEYEGFRAPKSYQRDLQLDSGCHCIEGYVEDFGVITGFDMVFDLQGDGIINSTCCPCAQCGSTRTSGVEQEPGSGAALALQCIPNPVTGRSSVRCTVPGNCHLLLELYASDGTLVRVVADARIPRGTFLATIDRQGIAAGTYHLRLQCGTASTVIPVVME